MKCDDVLRTLAEQLIMDVNVYGNAYVERTENGTWRRIAPSKMFHLYNNTPHSNVADKTDSILKVLVGNKRTEEPQYFGIFCSACGEVSISSRLPDDTGVIVCASCGCDVWGDSSNGGTWNRVKIPEEKI